MSEQEWWKADPVAKPAGGDEWWKADKVVSEAPSITDRVVGGAKALGSGVAEGVIGMAGAPYDMAQRVAQIGVGGANKIRSLVGAEPIPMPEELKTPMPGTSGYTKGVIENNIGEFHKSQNLGEEYLHTAGEFAPSLLMGPGGAAARTLPKVAKTVGLDWLLPSFTSETAGQLAPDQLKPYARFVGGLVPNLATGFAKMYGNAPDHFVQRNARGITPEQWDAAEAAGRVHAGTGVNTTGPERIADATGTNPFGAAMRNVEASEGGGAVTRPFFENRTRQLVEAKDRALDTLGPQDPNPSTLGQRAGIVAGHAIAASPEGQELTAALTRTPRVEPGEAGAVIQPALGAEFDARVARRAAASDPAYEAARASTTPVDTTNTLATIGQDLIHAKGATATALREARDMLHINGMEGVLDTSVEGLHNTRKELNTIAATADRAGDTTRAAAARRVLNNLDAALEAVPEYAAANQVHAANSRPLDPFENVPPIAKTIERDEFNTRYTLPPEKVPETLQQGGPSTSRAFNEVAPAEARTAYENRLTTHFLDQATNPNTGRVSADSLAQVLRDNAELLAQHPEVAARIQEVLTAQRNMPVGTPLNRIRNAGEKDVVGTADPTVAAAEALLPSGNVHVGQEGEIAANVRAMGAAEAGRHDGVTSALLRQRLANAANKTMVLDRGGQPNQWGASDFAKEIAGSSQEEKNLRAALGALPVVPERAAAPQTFADFLQTARATGTRLARGSNTAVDLQTNKEMAKPSPWSSMARFPSKVGRFIVDARNDIADRTMLGNRYGKVAKMFTAPDSVQRMRAIAESEVHHPMHEAFMRALMQQQMSQR